MKRHSTGNCGKGIVERLEESWLHIGLMGFRRSHHLSWEILLIRLFLCSPNIVQVGRSLRFNSGAHDFTARTGLKILVSFKSLAPFEHRIRNETFIGLRWNLGQRNCVAAFDMRLKRSKRVVLKLLSFPPKITRCCIKVGHAIAPCERIEPRSDDAS